MVFYSSRLSRRLFIAGSMKKSLTALLFVLAGAAATSSALAQQVTGTPGSPSATTTIDGKQLPPPPSKFEGVIKEEAKDSKPWWPPTVVPPKGAPNVLLIMTDDAGYGVSSAFGGVIPTPTNGSHREGGIALHAVSFHRPLFADARLRSSRAVITTPSASARSANLRPAIQATTRLSVRRTPPLVGF
jgi:hypothetical protein